MKEITAEILAIGDELLIGQTLDTNSHWLSQQLTHLGVSVRYRTVLADERQAILEAFTIAESRSDITLITGGLGPTTDDLTKPLLAEHFDCEMALHEEALEDVTEYFMRFNRELTALNRLQAVLPAKCIKITNERGTAPGMWFERNRRVFMSMPGVPQEMKHMTKAYVLPKIRETFALPVIEYKVVKTAGIGESFLADLIKPWAEQLPVNVGLAYLPSLGEVKLRLTAKGNDRKELAMAIDEQLEGLKKIAGEYIYGYGDINLAQAIGNLLQEKEMTVATAESCTGGYLAHLITQNAGSSAYYNGSVVAYQNVLKESALGVKSETLADYGAVSEQTVKEMAVGVRQRLNADFGLATSGIAGPGGGTEDKPVGTVWIAVASENQVTAKMLSIGGDRKTVIHRASMAALNLLRLTKLC
ncbi:MAG: competence/damage-inducible protein A [Cytophagales bacterium]|nr:competence/damage-inducible protein A [Cytophagales bacterium]